jgi:hypothetical protein
MVEPAVLAARRGTVGTVCPRPGLTVPVGGGCAGLPPSDGAVVLNASPGLRIGREAAIMHVGPDAGTPSTLAARWPRSPAGWRCGWSERPCWWPAAPTVAAARTRPARGASGVSIFEPARPTPRGLPWWSSPRASSRTSTKAGSTTWWGAAALWSSRTCHTGASGCGSGARVGGRAAGGPVGLRRPGHVRPQPDAVVLVGHSIGAVMAASRGSTWTGSTGRSSSGSATGSSALAGAGSTR